MILNEFLKLRFKNVEEPSPFSIKVQDKEGTIKSSEIKKFFKLFDIRFDKKDVIKCKAFYEHKDSEQVIEVPYYEVEASRMHLFSLYTKEDFLNFLRYETDMPHNVKSLEDKEWSFYLLGKTKKKEK